ncbi:hypothetical protein FB451DRAFT_1148432 [Mycena latifolia]|nr:hypothetical protein FB451DRAFT_1148432 [Mycena latifolia]
MTTLETVADSLETPFLYPISTTMRSLLASVQTVKRNKDDCTQMLEQIHVLLDAIIRLHIVSDTRGELSPSMLRDLGKFTETLHKVHTFVETQQEKSRIKQFFRRGEMTTLLKGCHLGLEQALEAFKIQGVEVLTDVTEMQQNAKKTHQEVLDLISTLSDGGSSDGGSSVISRVLSSSQNSSNSLSLLPSEPKIFHGRDSEVSIIIQSFSLQIPRIAILGAGGMGKTSLARAVLHHPQIAARYEHHRVFVSCDTAPSSFHLAALIGAHVGLKPGKNLTQPVIRHFSNSPPSLLILDNFETIWEPRESRGEVEKFLSLLADIDHLALIITMRGAERPASVQWTRPFLAVLQPLPQEAAHQTFIDIVDDGHAPEEVNKILLLTDNMPLAIDLMAHLVEYEGIQSVLNRWEIEKTSLLSEGHDKGSNLDLSISLSLDSPRITALPQAQDLLALLSVLPDGLSDVDLRQAHIPIDNILACKAALLGTALAYTDDQQRLKALVPIREYIHKRLPPRSHLIQPLIKHFNKLLQIHKTYVGTASDPALVTRLLSNFANIQNILMEGMHQHNPDLTTTIHTICALDNFSMQTGRGQTPLMKQIPNVMPHPMDYQLEVYLITYLLAGWGHRPIPDAQRMIDQAQEYFTHFEDPDLKCAFYIQAAKYYRAHARDMLRATEYAQAGLSLSISLGNTGRQSGSIAILAWIKWTTGDYAAAQMYAYESQRLAKISGDVYREASSLRIESICWASLGNYSRSISLAERARELAARCGMSGGDLDNLLMNNLAEVHQLKSEYSEARSIHTQILHTLSLEQEPHGHALALLNVAQIDIEIGAAKHDVHRNLDTAKSLLRTRNSIVMNFCDVMQATVDAKDGGLSGAIDLFRNCVISAWEKEPQVVTYCFEKLADTGPGRPVDQISYTWRVTFLVHSLRLKQKLEIHKALQFLGDMYLAQHDVDSAMSLFTVALEGFTQMDIHRSRGECMLRLGDISKLRGDPQKAVQLWKTARPLFERSSQAKQATGIDERLAATKLPESHSESLASLSHLHAPTQRSQQVYAEASQSNSGLERETAHLVLT